MVFSMTHALVTSQAVTFDPVTDDAAVVAQREADRRAVFCVDGQGHLPVHEAPDPSVGFLGATYCERCEQRL